MERCPGFAFELYGHLSFSTLDVKRGKKLVGLLISGVMYVLVYNLSDV